MYLKIVKYMFTILQILEVRSFNWKICMEKKNSSILFCSAILLDYRDATTWPE